MPLYCLIPILAHILVFLPSVLTDVNIARSFEKQTTGRLKGLINNKATTKGKQTVMLPHYFIIYTYS